MADAHGDLQVVTGAKSEDDARSAARKVHCWQCPALAIVVTLSHPSLSCLSVMHLPCSGSLAPVYLLGQMLRQVRFAAQYGKIITKLGYDARFQDFKVQNIVGSTDVKFPIRLEGLAYGHAIFASVSPVLAQFIYI